MKAVLVGIAGHAKGEVFPLKYGKKTSVGRSRSARISLRKTKAWLSKTDEERELDVEMKTVSGRHFTVTMFNTSSIEIHNLSPNGTFVDGKKIDRILISDASVRPHDIKFGKSEILRLQVEEE